MNSYSSTTISIPYCEDCKFCCHGIPTGVCGYHTLVEIEQGTLPPEICQKFVVYRIHKKFIDEAASRWWHCPDSNLLTEMTLVKDNFYEILAIAKTRGKCPLLGPYGCLYPDAKPFNCEIFPFYIGEKDFHIASWCKFIDKLDVRTFESPVKTIIEEYEHYSIKNASRYYELLKNLQKKWQWTVHTFRPF
ncbi:hypothetical protein [Candidatus Lokiarchaeum ossiferum]|uniref:hypothetical protein n=1 Tax=Candidatus Lokiarchaeum ossiferum TaxID=2951803 RepID=UPI00352DA0A7